MVGYLRATIYGQGNLPEPLAQHLEGCRTCRENWDFLKENDEVVRGWREERVAVAIQRVLADESPATATPLGVAEREAFLRDLEMRLAAKREEFEEALVAVASFNFADVFPETTIVEICDRARTIDSDLERYRAAQKIAMSFAARVQRAQARGDATLEIVQKLFEGDEPVISVQNWEVELVASFPQTSYFRRVAVLEAVGDQINFHRKAFESVRAEFDAVRQRLEDVPAGQRI